MFASRAGGDHDFAGAASPSARTTTERGAAVRAPAPFEGRAAQARLAERHREVCIFVLVAWIQRAWACGG